MALALCLSLVSVGAVAEVKVSLKFATNWGPGDAKYDYFEPLYNAYVDSVKDSADIQIETLSTVDYKTKIKVEMASGELPDVFTWWGGALLKDMVDSDLLLNVDDYFAASKAVTRDQFVDGSFGYYTLGGNTYGVPLQRSGNLNATIGTIAQGETPVTGATIKADPALADMDLIRQSRLSVGRVTPAEWKHILKKSEQAEG